MKIGMFGYPGDNLERTQAVCEALRKRGAETLVCLGGMVWSGRRGEEQGEPVSVLRWLRANDIPTLCNDMDRQVAGWRLQALANTTGYIRPAVRIFLGEISREEAQWMYSRPAAQAHGQVLCCADCLMLEALYPVPLTAFNAGKLFAVMEQKAAFFPSAQGPTLLVRKQDDNALEAAKYEDIEESLDCPKVAGVIGGVCGHPPLNAEVGWGAVVDAEATALSLVCLDARTRQPAPERARMLLQRAELTWRP